MEKLLTVREVADMLQCHPQSLYKNSDLPRIDLPGVGIRYNKSEINNYLENKTFRHAQNITQIIDFEGNNLTLPPDFDKVKLPKLGGLCEMPKGKTKARYNLGYGAIYQRKTKKGKIRWYLDYKDADGKRIQKVAPNSITKEEAVLALKEEIKMEFDQEYQIKRKKDKTKFEDFVDMYIENYAKANKKSWDCDLYKLEAHMKPFFKDIHLNDITPLLIEKYRVKRLDKGVKKSTLNRDIALLKKMFNLAIDWDITDNNPLLKVKLFSEKEYKVERILTELEEIRLLKESSEHLKTILIIALNTGMRRNEILKLKWKQIDLAGKIIKVENTKSGNSRLININCPLLKTLCDFNNQPGNSDYLFFNPKTQKPITTVKTAFKAACRRAGIENLRFHDLRHTFASRLIKKGADLITVKELLGHSSVTVTQRYTHSNQIQKKAAVDLLDKKMSLKANNQEDLLRICDTEQPSKKDAKLSYLFSIN